MSYYKGSSQGSYTYNVTDDRPMLETADDEDFQETVLNTSHNDEYEYNEEAEREANQLLDEFKEFFPTTSATTPKKCDTLEVEHHDGPIPIWYKKKLESKIRETKERLEILSNLVCNLCSITADHIKRIQHDHGSTFCKMDYPRYPSLDKPWTNSWKFNCTVKCKDTNKPNHTHTDDCKSIVVLEHADTGVSLATSSICHNEYPDFLMGAVQLFQNFANETIGNVPFCDVKGDSDAAYETTMWTGVKLVLRSNYEKQLMIVVRGKRIGPLRYKLKRYFEYGPGKCSNVISVSCIGQTWSHKKGKIEPELVTGIYKLHDRIGSLYIDYKPKISIDFNSIEAAQMSKVIKDYAGLTLETTLLDIGCNFGVLSLLMSDQCERVIGLNTMHSVNNEIIQAEEIKKLNEIENVSFIACDPQDIITKCSALCKRYITVAVLNLATPYGKSKYTIEALRNIPSIWRVIVYGSFTKEFRMNIVKLTTGNVSEGEQFLPMQGCILDKSPSVESAFDIVIMFERTSLITPKLKLEVLGSGPTVNVKVDSETYKHESCIEEELKPKVSVDRNQQFENSNERHRKSPHSPSSRSSKKYNRSPSPKRSARPHSPKRSARRHSPRRSVRSPSPRRSTRQHSPKRSARRHSPKRYERSPSPRRSIATDRSLDRSVIEQKPHLVPPVHKEKHTAVKEERLSPKNKNRPPSSTTDGKSFDRPVLDADMFTFERLLEHERPSQHPAVSYPSLSIRKEFQFIFPSPPREQPPSPPPPPPSANISLSIRKEFQFICSSPPREQPPSPSPSADSSLLLDTSHIKQEKNTSYHSWTTIITEPEQSQENTEDSASNSMQDDGVPIKSEITAPIFSANSSNISCENIPLPVIVKTEPTDQNEVPSQCEIGENIPQPVTFNSESVNHRNVPPHTATSENEHHQPVTIKSEPMDSSQVVTDENVPLPVTVKSEPVDSSDEVPPQPTSCENIPLPAENEEINCENSTALVTAKSEPADLFKVPSQPLKNEPQDMKISPNEDIENMETPLHTPRSVSGCTNSIFANLNGFEISLEANKSYMNLAREAAAASTAIGVKTESGRSDHLESNTVVSGEQSEQHIERSTNCSIKKDLEEGEYADTDEEVKEVDEKKVVKTEFKLTDDEIKIIGEKSEQLKESKSRIRVKSEDEIKVKSEVAESDDDIRNLIEQRKKILEKLGQENGTPCYKGLPRSYKRSSSPSRSSKKHNRSPSPRRSARSPSPHRHRSPSSKRRKRSPHRSRRSPSPNYKRSRRSPTSPIRVKREPHSPDRFKRNKRSPSSSSSKRDIYGRTSPVKSSHDRRKRSKSRSPKRRKSKSPSRTLSK